MSETEAAIVTATRARFIRQDAQRSAITVEIRGEPGSLAVRFVKNGASLHPHLDGGEWWLTLDQAEAWISGYAAALRTRDERS
jgi:hypothetical protein